MTLLYKNEHISCTNYAEEFNKVREFGIRYSL